MAKDVQKRQVFDFFKGIVSDSSVVGFPEGAVVDQENLFIEPDGLRRRKGLDLETDYVTHPYDVAAADAITTYKWDSVNSDASVSFVVAQIGSTVFFYKDLGEALSANKANFTIDLSAFPAPNATSTDIAQNPVDMAHGRGHLFIVGRYIEPLYAVYNATDDTLDVSQITIQERDLEGIDDGYADQFRPASSTTAHTYNLHNQGWDTAKITAFYSGSGSTKYPSLADRWIKGKIKNGTTGLETFDYNMIIMQDFGNASAPRGRFIRNIFNTAQMTAGTSTFTISTWSYVHGTHTVTITTSSAHGLSTGQTVSISSNTFDYQQDYVDGEGGHNYSDATGHLNGSYTVTVTGGTTFTITKNIFRFDSWIDQFVSLGTVTVAGLDMPSGYEETTDERPQAVAWFAGRVWYAGIQSDRLGGRVYFTQTVEKNQQYGYCYQNADPTSEHIPDLVDTDGGQITIGNLGLVYKMKVLGLSLFVFSSNGVWEISGPQDSYFRTTSYLVRKLSDIPCVAKFSPVNVDVNLCYWSTSGIQAISYDDQARRYINRNITEHKLDNLFFAIADANKAYVVAKYDDVNKRVYWLYGSDATYKNKYDLALVLDMKYGAFYKLRFPVTSTAYVAGIQTQRVYTDVATKVKFLTIMPQTNDQIAFSEFNAMDFLDWFAVDAVGTDTSAFVITGYDMAGDPTVEKHTPLIYCYFKKTETGFSGTPLNLDNPSGCLMQARWNWNISASGNKWSDEQQVYRFRRNYVPTGIGDTFDDGEQIIVTRNKIRGRGKAVHLRFASQAAKDMYFLGWSIEFQGHKVN